MLYVCVMGDTPGEVIPSPKSHENAPRSAVSFILKVMDCPLQIVEGAMLKFPTGPSTRSVS